jgi:hypothetical protein
LQAIETTTLVIAAIVTVLIAIVVVAFLRKRCSAKKSHNKYDVNDPSHKPSSDPKKQDCVLNGFSEVQFSNFVGSEIKNV